MLHLGIIFSRFALLSPNSKQLPSIIFVGDSFWKNLSSNREGDYRKSDTDVYVSFRVRIV